MFDTEGTVKVSTDHTSGSSFGGSTDIQHFTTPVFEKFQATQTADAAVTTKPSTGVPNGSIEFRVIRPGSAVRRLRLTGNRYTFGSAEGCSIRLNDPALRPMHAVMIRDRARVLIRAYSVPIEVNGTRMSEASLDVGDVFCLGAYQFELVSRPNESIRTGLEGFPETPASIFETPHASPMASKKTSSIPPQSPKAALPASDEVIWHERLRREIEQWRDRRVECDVREQRCDQREATLHGRESELWSRAENLFRREALLQSQETSVFQLHDEHAQRQKKLNQLREETAAQQQIFLQREAEFRRQESEYRSKLDKASHQLQQSQQQAQAATHAVQRMREQFASLNRQIDELSTQQRQIEDHAQRQQDEHKQQLVDLERQRDQAIEGQTESEVRRREAEARVEEMEIQLTTLQSGQGAEFDEQLAKLKESEDLVQQLQDQVTQLQQTIADASEESSRLRLDYQEACQSVRQLELLVAQSNERGDQDRESWTAEADELRSAIDRLALDLARANSEVAELSDANSALSARLMQVQQERDDAQADVQSRPTQDAFQALRDELNLTNQKLDEMKREYDRTLALLSEMESEQDRSNEPAPVAEQESSIGDVSAVASLVADGVVSNPKVADPDGLDDRTSDDNHVWPASQMASMVNSAVGEADPVVRDPANESIDFNAPVADIPLETDAPVEDEPEGIWQETPAPVDDVQLESDAPVEDEAAAGWHDTPVWNTTPLDGHESDVDPWSNNEFTHLADNPVGLYSDEVETPPVEHVSQSDAEFSENRDGSDESQSDAVSDSPEMTSVWGGVGEAMDEVTTSDAWSNSMLGHEVDADEYLSGEQETNDVDAESPSIVDGSLASMLIKDLESEGQADECDGGTFLMSHRPDPVEPAEVSPWDQEYPEESDARPWSNDEDDQQDATYVSEYAEPSESISPLGSDSESLSSGDEYDEETCYQGADSTGTLQELPTQTESLPDSSSDDSGADDDSIEAYMNRLLNRVQGTPASGGTAQPDTVSLSITSTALTAENPTEIAAETVTHSDSIDLTGPLVPRSKAPERNSDLSAMRDLANQTARSAISRSTRIQTRNIQIAGMCNFAVAGVAMLAALGGCFILTSPLLYLAWLMATVVAVISLRDGWGNFAEAKRQMEAANKGAINENEDRKKPEPLKPSVDTELTE